MSVALSPASVIELLKRLPLFNSLPERDLAWLADRTRVDHLERDAVIFYQGDPCERVCILRQGQVKIIHHDEGGREVILEMISSGEV
ncbi:MAG: cyclic nucleotide-binding domain-containing protein, partial [Chloroflexota bacterium]